MIGPGCGADRKATKESTFRHTEASGGWQWGCDWDQPQGPHSSENCGRCPGVPAAMEMGWLLLTGDHTQPFQSHMGKMREVEAVLRKQQHSSTSRKLPCLPRGFKNSASTFPLRCILYLWSSGKCLLCSALLKKNRNKEYLVSIF